MRSASRTAAIIRPRVGHARFPQVEHAQQEEPAGREQAIRRRPPNTNPVAAAMPIIPGQPSNASRSNSADEPRNPHPDRLEERAVRSATQSRRPLSHRRARSRRRGAGSTGRGRGGTGSPPPGRAPGRPCAATPGRTAWRRPPGRPRSRGGLGLGAGDGARIWPGRPSRRAHRGRPRGSGWSVAAAAWTAVRIAPSTGTRGRRADPRRAPAAHDPAQRQHVHLGRRGRSPRRSRRPGAPRAPRAGRSGRPRRRA